MNTPEKGDPARFYMSAAQKYWPLENDEDM